MHHRILVLFIAFSGVAALSCGGNDGPSALEVCTRRAEILCAKRSECTQGYDIQRSFGSLAACRRWERQACVESVERTGSGNDVNKNQRCNTALEAQTCEQRTAGTPTECRNEPGAFKRNAVCISSNQCASLHCKIPPGMTCGRCAERGSAGAACESGSDCAEGHFCYREGGATTGEGTCTAFQAPGDACNGGAGDRRCGPDVSCVGFSATNGTDGTCVARTEAEGQACNSSLRCLAGLTCVGARASMNVDGMCQRTGGLEGDTCDRNAANAPGCDGTIGLYCHQLLVPGSTTRLEPTGVCRRRPFAATGEPCGAVLEDRTEPVCQNGDTCQRPINPDTGAPQTNMPGVCVARAASGMACNTNGDIGPSCPVGHACVLDTPGESTQGKCVKRDYEVACLDRRSKSP
jgi:hypothetical protein